MSTHLSLRRTHRSAIAVILVAVVAGCGSSAGTEARPPTTTTTTAVEAKGDAPTTSAVADRSAEEGLPTNPNDAPSGTWLAVRYQTEKSAAGSPAGLAEGRRYDLRATCEDDSCDLTLAPVDGSFVLPDVDPTGLSSDPIELTATGDAWAGSYTDTYGCTDELDGDYITSTAAFGLAPIWIDGEIVNLVGTIDFTDELTTEGQAAGCPTDTLDSLSYQVVMASDTAIQQTFQIDGRFFESQEVVTSKGITSKSGAPGYRGYNDLAKASSFSGSCADETCAVTRSFATAGKAHTVELSREDGAAALTGTSRRSGGCVDATTGVELLSEGAYVSDASYSLLPLLVIEGEAKVLLGEIVQTSSPTELGKTQGPGMCDVEQSKSAYEYLVAEDLYS